MVFIGYPSNPKSGYLESVQKYIRQNNVFTNRVDSLIQPFPVAPSSLALLRELFPPASCSLAALSQLVVLHPVAIQMSLPQVPSCSLCHSPPINKVERFLCPSYLPRGALYARTSKRRVSSVCSRVQYHFPMNHCRFR